MEKRGNWRGINEEGSKSPIESPTMSIRGLSGDHPASSSCSSAEVSASSPPADGRASFGKNSAAEVYNCRKKWWQMFNCGVPLGCMGPASSNLRRQSMASLTSLYNFLQLIPSRLQKPGTQTLWPKMYQSCLNLDLGPGLCTSGPDACDAASFVYIVCNMNCRSPSRI